MSATSSAIPVIPAIPSPTPPQKLIQPVLTVTQVMSHASIEAVVGKRNWTRSQKDAVAAFLANRIYIDQRGASAADQVEFAKIWEKVNKLIDRDQTFAEAMDPSYIVVDFAGAAPANYRAALDHANAAMGGAAAAAPPAAGAPPTYTVRPGAANLIQFVSANKLDFLTVPDRPRADFVAGQIQALSGLSAWVLETKVAARYW